MLNKIFGFKECKNCKKNKNCDKKPWLHIEKDCNYNIVNKR